MIFNSRTLKTVLSYGLSLIEKITRVNFKKNNLTSIFNYLPISSNIATSGQPTAQQLGAIRSDGYQKIINLAPPIGENSLANEADLVADLGMDYINIPVDFSHPTEADFEQFVLHMQNQDSQKIWVHCAANMRVSCFIFKYRTAILGGNLSDAEAELKKIWQPNKLWQDFIDKPRSV
jgi:protein tyrosine phosphatase (PTP) superfamily phosphohydrolase (DUF442 family)